MKSLSLYIKEAFNDDNIFDMLDLWFQGRPDDEEYFTRLLVRFIKDRPSQKDLADMLKNNEMSAVLPQFISFINDEPETAAAKDTDKNRYDDAVYQLWKLLSWLTANKSARNKWAN